jgi:hypothetical protein
MRGSSTPPKNPKLGHHESVRSTLLIAVALALLLPSDATTAAPSGLWGVVRRGPITPVCMEGRPCSEPAANVTLVFARNGREAARATTRRDGSYRVALAPGAYRVRSLMKLVIGRGLEPGRVMVPSGHRTRIDFTIDTGIR